LPPISAPRLASGLPGGSAGGAVKAPAVGAKAHGKAQGSGAVDIKK